MTEKAIIVEDVEGLADAIGISAIALVWEDRIVIDAKFRKKPRLRRNILRHERRHILNARKRGMTTRAWCVNFLIEMEYRWAFWAAILMFGLLIDRSPWLAPFAVVPFVLNALYWRMR